MRRSIWRAACLPPATCRRSVLPEVSNDSASVSRTAPACSPPWWRDGDAPQSSLIETTRTRSEQSELALTVGRRVALGLRRFHVLPTPISSFVIAAADPGRRAQLEGTPLLAHLIASMRARVIESDLSAEAAENLAQAGVVVVPKLTARRRSSQR